jgi:hypothetical protein
MTAPLSTYRLLGCDVRLTCNACLWSRLYPLEDVIARMCKRGLAGEAVPIRDVARYTRGNCPRCGAYQWETTPGSPNVPGQMGR